MSPQHKDYANKQIHFVYDIYLLCIMLLEIKQTLLETIFVIMLNRAVVSLITLY